MNKRNDLTDEEKRVIIHKGTEAPFRGEYTDHFENGHYVCRQCETPLYRSESKFHSSCGWPSFDDSIPGKVEYIKEIKISKPEVYIPNTITQYIPEQRAVTQR